MNRKQYNYAFAIMTTIATLAVVMLHGSSYVFGNTGDNLWKSSLVIQAIFIPAVPIFFMMSGANLLDYSSKYSTRQFLIKRVKRTGVAFLVFSIIWYIYNYLNGVGGLSILNFIKVLSNNQINEIFWYFYALFICYLLTPILTHIAHNKRLLQYCIASLLLLGTLISFTNHFLKEPVFIPINLSFLVNKGLLYYILGYYLSNYVRPLRRMHIYILSAAMIVIVAVSWFLSMRMNLQSTVPNKLPYNNFWIDAFGLNITIYSVLLFMCLNQISIRRLPIYAEKILKDVAQSSLIVYGIHYIVINQIDKLYATKNAVVLLGVRPFVAFVISTIIGVLYYKIKKLVKSRI